MRACRFYTYSSYIPHSNSIHYSTSHTTYCHKSIIKCELPPRLGNPTPIKTITIETVVCSRSSEPLFVLFVIRVEREGTAIVWCCCCVGYWWWCCCSVSVAAAAVAAVVVLLCWCDIPYTNNSNIIWFSSRTNSSNEHYYNTCIACISHIKSCCVAVTVLCVTHTIHQQYQCHLV